MLLGVPLMPIPTGLPALLLLPVDAFPRRSPVAVYNRATAYPSQHSNHWIHHVFQTTTQRDAWIVHGLDALLRYHRAHAGDPAYARELTGAGSTGGWARSAWGSVMRRPSAV